MNAEKTRTFFFYLQSNLFLCLFHFLVNILNCIAVFCQFEGWNKWHGRIFLSSSLWERKNENPAYHVESQTRFPPFFPMANNLYTTTTTTNLIVSWGLNIRPKRKWQGLGFPKKARRKGHNTKTVQYLNAAAWINQDILISHLCRIPQQ